MTIRVLTKTDGQTCNHSDAERAECTAAVDNIFNPLITYVGLRKKQKPIQSRCKSYERMELCCNCLLSV